MMTPERFKHYTLGIPELDNDHWELFEILNKLSIAKKNCNSDYSSILKNKFVKLFNLHTNREIELAIKWRFPFTEYHDSSHPTLIDMLYKRTKLSTSECLSELDVSDMINSLCEHIDKYDFQYVPFYKAWKEKHV